ncbi:MAG: proprotein convertase P-domain-containing protein [Pirellulales bacterium]|nr:proprotein convertase P-domain-containing protein [Pirellulales bacterium]
MDNFHALRAAGGRMAGFARSPGGGGTRRVLRFEPLESRVLLAADLGSAWATAAPVVEEAPVDPWYETASRSLAGEVDETDPAPQPSDLELVYAGAAPLEDTFFLHSLPGATKVIYLDFDGHTTSGTQWNTSYNGGAAFTTPAYSFEGDSTFSANELTRIQAIWARVAEDFLPFNVNVTTQDPGVNALRKTSGNDSQYGIRVVIGGSWSDWYGSSAGGVAYVNSFTSSTDTPAFIFSQNLSNGSEKSVAEAIAHEVGHSLGLNHDGTTTGTEYYGGHGSGATGWAPIMGVGYNRQLTQWSKGQYPDANNTQDDLAHMTRSATGVTYRTDDHGGTIASATNVTIADASVSAEGIVERNTDVDFFRFTTADGAVNLNVSPAAIGPNLDILAKLYDSVGTVIAASNPETSLSASFSLTLTAGTYYLSVEGTGKAASGTDYGYSDYGSLGYYKIAGTIALAPVLGSLQGVVWSDDDRDGVRGPGEAGLAGWTVYIDGNDNGTLDVETTEVAYAEGALALVDGGTTVSTVDVAGVAGTIYDLDVTLDVTHGNVSDLYVWLESPAGTTVDLLQLFSGWGPDLDSTHFDDEAPQTIQEGEAPYSATFKPAAPLSAFDGQSADGVWTLRVFDAVGGGSGTLEGWSLSIHASAEAIRQTDAAGEYVFASLVPGTYVVRQVVEEGWEQTAPAGVGVGRIVTVGSGEAVVAQDFGNAVALIVAPSADFNLDHYVDGGDFLAWQRGFGATAAAHADGDANFDGVVDASDLEIWFEQYGETEPPVNGAPASAPAGAIADEGTGAGDSFDDALVDELPVDDDMALEYAVADWTSGAPQTALTALFAGEPEHAAADDDAMSGRFAHSSAEASFSFARGCDERIAPRGGQHAGESWQRLARQTADHDHVWEAEDAAGEAGFGPRLRSGLPTLAAARIAQRHGG